MTMTKNEVRKGTRIAVRNILYLTDFSEQSEAALPFAAALARNYGATVHALHVLTPVIPEGCREAIEADEKIASDEMKKVDVQLTGVEHDVAIAEWLGFWPAIERAIRERSIDLIVVGTHGRTHARKFLLGSVAEEIFRRANVPVLTIGPDVARDPRCTAEFRSVLFATDFTKPCDAAAPYAISVAEENNGRLTLLYVGTENDAEKAEEIVHRLNAIVPGEARLWCRTATVVHYGDVAGRILQTAAEYDANLIVLGVRDPGRHLGATTHLERAIAHRVVAHATCPVLTVRG